jgi:hypothetical protein
LRLREELDQKILPVNYKTEEDYLNALKWQEGARINYSFERAMQGPALAMMRRGILVDQYYRWEVIASLERRINHLQNVLNEFACAVWGKPLNPNSHHQLKLFFYGAMALPEQHSYVKGQRNVSINRDALEKLSIYFHAEPICNCIIRLRDLSKKVSVLRTEVDGDSRMRTSYNVAGPETGRWSSSSNVYGGGTNLQNITEELRRIFIADGGFKLAYIDLSQAESRCLAFLCYTLFGSHSMTKLSQTNPSITDSHTGTWRKGEDTQVTIMVSLSPFLGISKYHSSSSNPSNLVISMRFLNFESTTDGALVSCNFEVKFPPPFSPPDTSLGE